MTNLHSDKIKTANLHTTTNHIYTNTKLRKLLVPIIIEQLLASLMGTVDIYQSRAYAFQGRLVLLRELLPLYNKAL